MRDLDQERQRHRVDAQRDEVHRPEAQELPPPAATDLEDEPACQQVRLEDTDDVRDAEDHKVVDLPADADLQCGEHAVYEGGVDDSDHREADDLAVEQAAQPVPPAPVSYTHLTLPTNREV